jgi:predicted nucleic acid-binding protein
MLPTALSLPEPWDRKRNRRDALRSGHGSFVSLSSRPSAGPAKPRLACASCAGAHRHHGRGRTHRLAARPAAANSDARREHVYRRLAGTAQAFTGWIILPFPIAAMQRHAALIRSHLNIGSFDLKIAAIALEYQATVVTRNIRDFARVPGLSSIDWSI